MLPMPHISRISSLSQRLLWSCIAVVSLFLLNANAAAPTAKNKKSSYEKVWDYANLYENASGNYFKLSGRLQADGAWFNSNEGDFDDVNWRRFRFGFKSKYGNFTTGLEGDFNLNHDDEDVYNRLTDTYISWALNKNTHLTFLKQSAGFTLDGKTSSKKLMTPQRNNLTNNLWFTAEYFSGVSIKGSLASNWNYKSGIYSTDDSDEIGFTQASYFSLMSLNKKFDKNILWDKAELGFDYVYNDTHIDGNTLSFGNVISLSSKLQFAKWHVWTDLATGDGDLGQNDVWGAVVMPYYQVNKHLQYVMRYTYLDSENANGLRLGRYENKAVSGRGDNYHELYAGANYLFLSHQLKVHLGVQYTNMADEVNDGGEYKGWGVSMAVRSYW
jgi:phosphate-selective porin OprO/OprP